MVLGCRYTANTTNRVVSGACSLTGGVSEYNIAHRRSGAVLVFCIKSGVTLCTLNFYGALPVPCVPVRVARGALVVRRYTYATPRCTTSQCFMTFILLSEFLWNDLADPYSMVWDWRILRVWKLYFFIGQLCPLSFFFSCF